MADTQGLTREVASISVPTAQTMEDPLTLDDVAASFVLDEDDEILAESQLAAAHAPLLLTLRPALATVFSNNEHGPRAPLLLVAFGTVARSLVHALPGVQLAGSLLAPELSLKGNGFLPSPTDSACCHLFTSTSTSPSDAAPVVLAAADAVPWPRAFDWASALLVRFRPASLVVLEPAAATDGAARTALARAGAPCCVLQTDAASSVDAPTVPLLPPGPLLGGAAAALMTHGQARGLPGRLYVYSPPDYVLTGSEVAKAVVHALSADALIGSASAGKTLQWDAALQRAQQAGCFADMASGHRGTFT